ncbi:MAG TPA: glutamate--tRNA ligase family protein, partial [Minicystis sp.]|nr:glutamate--tRNA ligase family protein [Minicystis sp.]
MTRYRGRFAPSPTGPLHLGSAATALVAAARARERDRIELVRRHACVTVTRNISEARAPLVSP